MQENASPLIMGLGSPKERQPLPANDRSAYSRSSNHANLVISSK
jgi:hypothetical protein